MRAVTHPQQKFNILERKRHGSHKGRWIKVQKTNQTKENTPNPIQRRTRNDLKLKEGKTWIIAEE